MGQENKLKLNFGSSDECVPLVVSPPSYFLVLRALNSDLSTDCTDGH